MSHTRFFNLGPSVLLSFFMNWASDVAYVLFNTYKDHHTAALYILCVLVYFLFHYNKSYNLTETSILVNLLIVDLHLLFLDDNMDEE